ncbi:MAG: hypothetical protein KTR27_05305 [Leptolyngbyaceae cyanobacterium MAG.088]|nr:hypothetical protein [Leptolyngbyaceae cyanobacterium MAG.088]
MDTLTAIEQRFRFVAADGITVLKGQTEFVTYRQVLIQVCRYLKLRYSPIWKTTELESEIFLHLVQRTWKKLPRHQRKDLMARISEALSTSPTNPLPLNCQDDSLRLFLQGGSALAISSVVRPVLLRQVARQFVAYFATYQAGRTAASLQGQIVLQAAKKGMAFSAARYGALRSACMVLGTALWAGFVADLGWRAISTNYSRVIPIIFTLAQIRLVRGGAWQLA